LFLIYLAVSSWRASRAEARTTPVDATVGLAAGSLAEKVLYRPSVRRRMERVSAVIAGGLAVRLALDNC
jgi:threonine/homoserine/homoserine lactone efflux protein